MANNVADETQNEPRPLAVAGLVGALARLARAHSYETFTPHVEDPAELLVKAFETAGQTGLIIKVGDEVVGKYTVDTTQPKFVVDVENEEALNTYADDHNGTEIVVRRNATWEKALLKFARRDEETGEIIDSRTGELVPGLKYVPGGHPTGSVTFTWDKKTEGQVRLMKAWQSGSLDHLLHDVPELAAKQPVPPTETS